MKTIAIQLRLATASHRKRMMGIFRQIGASDNCDVRIIPDERSLCDLIESADQEDLPDGIISGLPYSEQTKLAISNSRIPFVGIGMSEKEFSAPIANAGFVLNDNIGIGRTAAEYFLSLGTYRSYAFIPDTKCRNWSVDRGRGFADALARANKDCFVFEPKGNDTTALSEFLLRLHKPTAILAAWDGRAADVIRVAHISGFKIPEDIAILGVDNDELICEHVSPPLSSVKTDAEGMGEAAAKILFDLIYRRVRNGPRNITCPVLGVTERSSAGAPTSATTIIQRAMAFIDSEVSNHITPDDVARYLKISRRLLDLRFQQLESKSITEIINDRKLENAKNLLTSTAIPVKNIFKQSGFGDISYATKYFKKKLGSSPEKWRQAHRVPTDFAETREENSEPKLERLTEIEKTDAAALKKLTAMLDPDSDFDAQTVQKEIQQGVVTVFVLREKGQIIASATAVRFTTPTGSHCRIEDVVVDARHRGKGLGRRIMSEAIESLKRSGVNAIELTSRPARIEANALYKALGFALRKTNVYRLSFS